MMRVTINQCTGFRESIGNDMAEIAFRFDIDSHKCIRDGVPILLDISKKYGIPFTFFVNAGRAISIGDTLKTAFSHHDIQEGSIKMLSAHEKLGTLDYLYAAAVNPPMTKYADNIRKIWNSDCEFGLHGGMNHSHWYMNAGKWDKDKIDAEIKEAVRNIRNIIPEYKPCGFAAPGFVTSDKVEEVLKANGFCYSNDWHDDGKTDVVTGSDNFKNVTVNVCGEPGGVAYFEHAQALKMEDQKVIEDFMKRADKNEKLLVFDHPYFAAVQKRDLLDKLISELLRAGHRFVTVKEMCGIED